MKTQNDIRVKCSNEGIEIYRKTKWDTLVFNEEYVHRLEKLAIKQANGAQSKKSVLPILNKPRS